MKKRRPNIILFVTDDHASWALQHQGIKGLKTPNLDKLAREGLSFKQAFTPSPVCSPARACVMTGLTPSQVGIHDWLQEIDEEVAARDWLEGFDTLPEMFQRSGYQTFLSGKWHLGATPSVPRGFDHAFGLGNLVNTHNGADNYTVDGEPIELEGNRSRFIGDYACQYISEATKDHPFFLNVGLFSTHSPYVETKHDPELINQFRDHDFEDLPRDEAHKWSKAENGPPLWNQESDIEEERRKRWRGYYAGVAEIDREIGRILGTLKESGRAEETVIIYTSDHGCCLGHHGIWGKGNGTRPVNFTDTSMRVPLILSGSGIPQDKRSETPVSHYDTFETLRELCELNTIDGHPRSGESLLTLAEETPDLRQRPTYHEYGDARAVRTNTWKLIQHHSIDMAEAFELVSDPKETNPLPANLTPQQLQDDLEAYEATHLDKSRSGLRVNQLPKHNAYEPWRDGIREEMTQQTTM